MKILKMYFYTKAELNKIFSLLLDAGYSNWTLEALYHCDHNYGLTIEDEFIDSAIEIAKETGTDCVEIF